MFAIPVVLSPQEGPAEFPRERPERESLPLGGHRETQLDREYQSKEIAPGVAVREKESTRRYGQEYSTTLKSYSEAQFVQLADSVIDVRRLKLISLIDNSQTREAIQGSAVLSGIAVEAQMYTGDQLFAAIQQSHDTVVLLLTHISEKGLIQTLDREVPVRDLADSAKAKSIPLLVIGCRSADFLGRGYTTLLNSVDMVSRLASALESARTYSDFVNSLATPTEALQLDWAFLVEAGDILRIKIRDSNGDEQAVLYISGFPGAQGSAPLPTGLGSVAVQSGVPFWILRGLTLSAAMLLGACGVGFVKPGLVDHVLSVSSNLFAGCTALAAGVVVLLVGALVTSLMGWLGLLLFGLLAAVSQDLFRNARIPGFVSNHPRIFGMIALTALGIIISGAVG